MRRAFGRALAALVLSAPVSCSVNLSKSASGEFARNECTSDSECGEGACHSGACVAHKGALSTLLLEVAPPDAARGVGGLRALLVKTELGRSSDDTKIDLSPTRIVHGFVPAPATCMEKSFPVQITLTPREESYGLQTGNYVARADASAVVQSTDPCLKLAGADSIYEFAVAVPGGTSTYDIYVEPLDRANTSTPGDAGVPGSCALVPQLFRNQAVAECLKLPPREPQKLTVVIPWDKTATGSASLDGWTLDVVHPISAHVLSDRVVLGTRAPAEADYNRVVRFVPSEPPGKELVRLTPPEGVLGPVIQAELSGLQAADLTKAAFPLLGPFPAAVTLDSWVYERDHPQVPVPGTVTLTSTKLYGIKPGIFASFSVTKSVDKSGKLLAPILPGMYRARAVPQADLGLAASESTLDIACEHDSRSPDGCVATDPAHPPTRAGQVIYAPRAAEITGEVRDAITGARINSASVQADPAAFGIRECPKGMDAAACAAEPLSVLDLSLGEDAFVPRTVFAVTEGGRFTLKEVDCGGCPFDGNFDAATAAPGASFDVSVRPPDGSRFSWLLRTSVLVGGGQVPLGRLDLPLPIIHRGVVAIPQDTEPLPVPNALIKAYVMRDERGAVIDDPALLSSCASGNSASLVAPARCIRSVLQVAETRAANDGAFELVIPAAIQ